MPSVRARGGVGGTMWSKKPSFSSNMYKKTVLLQTSGFAVNASSIWETYQAPKFGGQFPCSVYDSGATIQETCGNWLLSTSWRKVSNRVPLLAMLVPVLAFSASGLPSGAF